MDTSYIILGIGVLVLVASLFSNKEGSTSLIFGVVVFLGIIVGLYNNPNIETFILILLFVTLYFFYTRRYWRNLENFRA